MYNILNMCIYDNLYHIDYILDFVLSLKNSSLRDIKKYYYELINKANDKTPELIQDSYIFKMSNDILYLRNFHNIIDYNIIDFNNTTININGYNSEYDLLFEICNRKMENYQDSIIAINYSNFKNKLKQQHPDYYHFIKKYEEYITCLKIYIENPFTNKIINISDQSYIDLIEYIKEIIQTNLANANYNASLEMHYILNDITNSISVRYNKIYKMYFG